MRWSFWCARQDLFHFKVTLLLKVETYPLMMHRKVNSFNALEAILAIWFVNRSFFSSRELDVLFFWFWWADHYHILLIFSVFAGKLFLTTLGVDNSNDGNAWFMILNKLRIYVVLLWRVKRGVVLFILDWLLHLPKKVTHAILVGLVSVVLAVIRALILYFNVLKTWMLWGFYLSIRV